MRALMRFGSSTLLLVAMMFAGSLVLWIGSPLAWLWIASQIQDVTGSVGAAVGAAMVGVMVSIALMMPVLSWLSRAYRGVRLARGLEDTGNFALETVLVTSAGIALVLFVAWFFLLAGTSPIPLNLSY
jgi:hypothetical protein